MNMRQMLVAVMLGAFLLCMTPIMPAGALDYSVYFQTETFDSSSRLVAFWQTDHRPSGQELKDKYSNVGFAAGTYTSVTEEYHSGAPQEAYTYHMYDLTDTPEEYYP
jgi:hypothetical protein